MKKVILILVDGLRPDAVESCGNPYGKELLGKGSYSLKAETVYPSVTLPCHVSLFLSVPPERHGTTTNTYTPQVRPINGLCEQLRLGNRKCAFFYNWEELRDLSRPSSLAYSYYVSGDINTYEKANEMVTENAISYIKEEKPDFAFVYLGLTDHVGHSHGWMGKEYMEACSLSLEEIRRIVDPFEAEYTIIITADHGGHGRSHGSREQEDMLIPLICIGPDFKPGKVFEDANICDIAPTIAALTETERAAEWEGKSLCVSAVSS
ncbi:MAG TPA: hypothetical protein DCZ91_10295 [Lachnospiraceae bacterium]|nr:hypothetical protein [Lachnospiraceae bacterium]